MCACISFLFGREGGGVLGLRGLRVEVVGTGTSEEALFIILFFQILFITDHPFKLSWYGVSVCGMMATMGVRARARASASGSTAWPVISNNSILSHRHVVWHASRMAWHGGRSGGVLLLRCYCGGVRWGYTITVHVMRVFPKSCQE